jgi:GT2 family glycosyltransferase
MSPAATPRISVVMPVRDAGAYLDDSIRSILDQTYSDFEFVIRNDGSVDNSSEILRRWASRDRRIRLFEGDEPLGPAESSNWVVRHSSSPLVARMDADDISHPDRLKRQLAVFMGEPDAALVGTLWEGIDPEGRKVRPRDRSKLSGSSRFAPFPHGSIMFRRDAFEQAGGYSKESNFWEDADLYLRLAALSRLLVLPDALYLHRASRQSTRLTSRQEEVEYAVDRMYRTLTGVGAGSAGQSETARLRQPSPAKVLPIVFVSLGSTRLWAGERTGVLIRLCRRAVLRVNARTFAILIWAVWGAISPRSLRFVLRTVIRLRDFAVRNKYPDGHACAWSPAALTDSGEASSRHVHRR